ncbi:integrase catalytic domain-containing protein [Arthrobacter rhombi]|uniref:integrase catalytic domain-containing protein n=1 Tax=Arthrobacter rhombi TaxID=71253 RepID=UPI003FD64270
MTLSARREITKKEASAYAKASKKERGALLDRLVAEVGWSRANARRQLHAALERKGPARAVVRQPRPRTYTYDTVKVLQRVWMVAGQPCGKYLAPVMAETLENMENHPDSTPFGKETRRYGSAVHAQLLAMSLATIDRLLRPFKARLHPDGKSTTRSHKNRHSEMIPIMTRIPVIDRQPGLVAIDTVAHCGHSAKGQYAFTLTDTDPFTGWTVNRAIKNKAARWVAEAMEDIASQFPYPIDHVHSDNGSEFLNDAVTSWADAHDIRMTRSRADHSNDNPFVEQKNGDIVRRSAFNYRYDTEAELALLRELWPLVNQRKNLFLPTKKAIGYLLSKSGRHVREYDLPRTPADRVRETGVMLPPQRLAVAELHRTVDLTALTRRIHQIQQELIHLAAAKTYSQAQAP